MNINAVRLVVVGVITGFVVIYKTIGICIFLNAHLLILIFLAVIHYHSFDICVPRCNIVATLMHLLCYTGLLSIWQLYNHLCNSATIPLEEARYSVILCTHPWWLKVAIVCKCMCVLCVSKGVVGINCDIFHMFCNS